MILPTDLPFNNSTQDKNIAWFLPRPKPDHYKGGMPLYCEKWLLLLAQDILMIPDMSLLNVFCGMNTEGVRIDIKEEVKPDICCDIHELTEHIGGQWDVILADPPYSNDEARDLYGTPKINYKKWTAEVEQLLRPGGLLIVYHKYVMPNPNPSMFSVVKRVFVGNRAYHVPRVAIYFQKKGEEEEI